MPNALVKLQLSETSCLATVLVIGLQAELFTTVISVKLRICQPIKPLGLVELPFKNLI